jgi:hypothetical protein
MAHEDLVLDPNSLADEAMRLDLAAGPDRDAGLNLHEGPDPRVRADAAPIEVGERLHDHPIAELAAVDQPVGGVVGRRLAHGGHPNGCAPADLDAAILGLDRWLLDRDLRGPDPYEGLNATRLAGTLKRSPTGRRVLIQLVKRAPFDLRPVLGIVPCHNAGALGQLLSAYSRMELASQAERERRIGRAVEILDGIRSPGYPQPCWGYPFDVETRVFGYPSTTPNTIATSFCGLGLLDAHEALADPGLRERAIGAGEFFLAHVPITRDGEGAFFGYFPSDRTPIHNANLLAGGFLARLASATGRADFRDAARIAATYALERQRDDGSWPYGERTGLGWVDGHHTGYVLDSLLRCIDADDRPELRDAYLRGLAYYRRVLVGPGGVPKHMSDRTYPIDAQCVAQALSTLATASRLEPAALDQAREVCSFALRRMRRRDGAFRFQRTRLWRNSTPHVRWAQAPMLDALTLLRSRLGGASEGR